MSLSETVSRTRTVAEREIDTVARTRVYLGLILGFAGVVTAISWVGGGAKSGFVPTVVDLLTPVEVIVPVLGFAFGYRTVLGDRRRGELDLLSTYPIDRLPYIVGVFVGRGVVLAVGTALSLLPAAALAYLVSSPESAIFASHSGADSVVLYLRFVAVTTAFSLVVLSAAIAVSAVANTVRGAVVLVVILLVVLVAGLDLGVLGLLSQGVVSDESLTQVLAVSPNSAYRGLVLETVVSAAMGAESWKAASPVASLVGLAAWLVVSLGIAVVSTPKSR
ncbi:MAG: ABC transporter permease subunit [Halobacteria archaeon]|nr:ABC transporter permease subunit [Halobacteria archaeon]